ncbi:MAG: kinase [Clostridia bacterium]|nr:kinase [Clostridia bacterium]
MIITRTPFRISFFGGGTDLPAYFEEHGGAVISTTIDKYLYITCRTLAPYWPHKHQLKYGSANEEVREIDEIKHPSIRETMRFFDVQYGLDLHYNTDIPARSGMGSSSSFTVGLVNALYGMGGHMPSKKKLAVDAIHIEQDLIGEAVGCQDQIAAAFGGLNYITFKKGGGFFVSPIVLKRERYEELEKHLLLVFTGFQRFASDIEKEKISNIRKKEDVLDRMSKITSEALDILTSERDICDFGKLMNETWMLKKSLSEKVSNSAIDKIYDKGLEAGAIGGKLLGAGGGGFMLFFCAPEKQGALLESLKDYLHIPFKFERNGSQVIYYREED